MARKKSSYTPPPYQCGEQVNVSLPGRTEGIEVQAVATVVSDGPDEEGRYLVELNGDYLVLPTDKVRPRVPSGEEARPDTISPSQAGMIVIEGGVAVDAVTKQRVVTDDHDPPELEDEIAPTGMAHLDEMPPDHWPSSPERVIDPKAAAPIILPTEEVSALDFPSGKEEVRGQGKAGVSTEPRRLVGHERPHVIGRARAGTGKSWTIFKGVERLRGVMPDCTPSDEQQVLIDMIGRSAGARTVGVVAFSNSIASEWAKKVPQGVDAKTMHKLGCGSALRCFGLSGDNVINKYKVDDIVCQILDKDVRQLRQERPGFLTAVKELVRLAKGWLVGLDEKAGTIDFDATDWGMEFDRLVDRYDIDLEEGDTDEAYLLAVDVMRRCMDPKRDGCIDMDDMVWLPCVTRGMRIWKYDLLCVDEAQDLNPAQQRLSLLAGKRIVYIGDDRQAIFGFTGSMTKSLDVARDKFDSMPEGCVVLPLTMTRRCGKAIVEEARRIVPDFQAHPDNGPGKILRGRYTVEEVRGNYWTKGQRRIVPYEQTYLPDVKDRDMIICRVNSHLILQCNEFHKRGRRAFILGRDVGDQIIALVDKLDCHTVPDLIAKATDWKASETAKEQAKRNPSDNRLISIESRADSIVGIAEICSTMQEFRQKVDDLFIEDSSRPGVMLSSIHKAKGLEAGRVFFLMPKGGECPHPMAKSDWEVEQEMNMKYVGITRAIDELTYVW